MPAVRRRATITITNTNTNSDIVPVGDRQALGDCAVVLLLQTEAAQRL